MPSRVIRAPDDLAALGRLLFALERPFTVEWRKGADRSHAQNRLMWEWAGQFASQMGDRNAGEVQAEWKLTIGVPILRAENDAFRLFYDKALKPLAYPEKLAAMEYVPVTSQMTVPQMRAFMDAIQRQGAEQGVSLTDPEAAR
ncbi:hypothetical protein UFOVP368_56 [uncultured Caudovirales phage]|uniref:Uncharacterized protein n=1 Tax=uncultured Caudovirales phage TaxID=2100421 RepID=A0A6J7WYJ8_9CAUD|nr:hypothetical protein UFOVP368_56 [uncultured Caudovirales phage]